MCEQLLKGTVYSPAVKSKQAPDLAHQKDALLSGIVYSSSLPSYARFHCLSLQRISKFSLRALAEILYLIFDYQQQLLDAIYSLKIVVGTIAFFGFFRVDFYLGCLGQVNLICTVIWKIDGSFIHKYALINLLTSSDQYSSIDLNLHAIY